MDSREANGDDREREIERYREAAMRALDQLECSWDICTRSGSRKLPGP
jgi:hypothetical protein